MSATAAIQQRNAARRWVLIASLAVILAACAGSSASSTTSDLLAQRFEPNSPQVFLDVISSEVAASEAITRCMKAQGFDYSVYPYSRELVLLPAMIEASADPVEFARTFGYGVTKPDLMGPDPFDVMAPPDPDYDIALYGRTLGEMFEDGEPPGGCSAEGGNIAKVAALDSYVDERERIAALVDADTTIEDLRSTWSRCMAEFGFSFYSPDEVIRHFNDVNNTLMMSSGPGTPIDSLDFDELLEEEIRTAIADVVTCEGATFRAERLKLAAEAEWSTASLQALEAIASAGSGEAS